MESIVNISNNSNQSAHSRLSAEIKSTIGVEMIQQISSVTDYVYAHINEMYLTPAVERKITAKGWELVMDENEDPIVVAPLV
jgi:hypothetical protein